MKNSIKIISAYDSNFQDIASNFQKSAELYSKRNNHQFRLKHYNSFNRHPSWIKIDLINEELQLGDSDYLFYVDPDCCFSDFNSNIAAETIEIDRTKNLWIANHLCTRKSFQSWKKPKGIFRFGQFGRIVGSIFIKRQPGIYIQIERPNAGVMLIKNTEWSRQFFQQVWSKTEYLNHMFYEQAAIQDLMGYYFEPSNGSKPNKPNEEIMNYIGWLPDRWNSVPSLMPISIGCKHNTQQSVNPALIHFAGMGREQTLDQMTQMLRSLNIY